MDSGLRLAHNRLARSVWMLLGHACIAIGTIGAMWSLFTFGLGVLLPPGMILGQF